MKQPYQPSSYMQVSRLANSALSWPNWFQLGVLLGSVERDHISSVAAQGRNCSVFRLIHMHVSVCHFSTGLLGNTLHKWNRKQPWNKNAIQTNSEI